MVMGPLPKPTAPKNRTTSPVLACGLLSVKKGRAGQSQVVARTRNGGLTALPAVRCMGPALSALTAVTRKSAFSLMALSAAAFHMKVPAVPSRVACVTGKGALMVGVADSHNAPP